MTLAAVIMLLGTHAAVFVLGFLAGHGRGTRAEARRAAMDALTGLSRYERQARQLEDAALAHDLESNHHDARLQRAAAAELRSQDNRKR